MATSISKQLLDRLNAKHRGAIDFSLATMAVVGGFELEPFTAGSVSVCNTGGYIPSLADLRTGKTIQVGHQERYRHGTLRCYRRAEHVYVGVFDGERLRSRALPCRLDVRETREVIDEGMFTWFGPKEYIGTPWSDNDPERCQVITVDHLRNFARQKPALPPRAVKRHSQTRRSNTSKRRKRGR